MLNLSAEKIQVTHIIIFRRNILWKSSILYVDTFSPFVSQFWPRTASTNVIHDFFRVVVSRNRQVSSENGQASISSITTLFEYYFAFLSNSNTKNCVKSTEKYRSVMKFSVFLWKKLSRLKLLGHFK